MAERDEELAEEETQESSTHFHLISILETPRFSALLRQFCNSSCRRTLLIEMKLRK